MIERQNGGVEKGAEEEEGEVEKERILRQRWGETPIFFNYAWEYADTPSPGTNFQYGPEYYY
eukprot:66697-Rhodomonas_salina.2